LHFRTGDYVYPIDHKNANTSGGTPRSMRPVSIVASVVFILTLLLCLWHNDFPASYHPDEPEKVAQVLDGHRNFRHPPLMLDAAAAVLHLVSGSQLATPGRAVQIGRWLSAFYIAIACAVFTLLAGLYGGVLAEGFAACFLAANTNAVLAGHFFKEDPLFALGLSLTFLAGALRWRGHRSWVSLIVLGAAAGFAAATKYLGVLAFSYAVALELSLPQRTGSSRRAWRLLVFSITAITVALLLNIGSWWNHFPALWRAVLEAGQTAYLGNDEIGTKIPHLRYGGMLFLESPLALIGLALCWWTFLRQARPIRQNMDRWLLLCAPLFLLLVFSFSTITAVRYFLPISLLLACLSGCGLAAGTRMLCEWVYQRWKMSSVLIVSTAVVVCALCQLPALLSLEHGFAIDDRRALRSYIVAELPANAVIAADELAALNATPSLPQRLVTRATIADLGDLAELPAQGVTHVVVCWYDSRRYVIPWKRPAANVASDFARRREFYLGLRERAQLLWHSDLVQPFPLRPGLSLYKLPSPPADH
jgi:4-amino-4-deoxy-L-arabinose transferase-like glycosyltransferase